MAKESFSQIEALWVKYGGNPIYKAMAAAVAMAESGGNTGATNKNSNGTVDRGLFQINSIHGSQSSFDVATNVRAAISISKNGTNWRPWCTAWSTGKCTGTFLGQGSPALKFLPGGSSTGTSAIGAAAAKSLLAATAAMRAIAAAKTQIGKPYKFGAESPGVAFDCSGLTEWAYRQAGINLPRTAAQQQAATTPITKAQAKPGDLVFYGHPAHHVGIYLGAGKYLEAPHTGAKIKITGIGSDSSMNFGRVNGSGAGTAANSGPVTATPAGLSIPGLGALTDALDPVKWLDNLVKPALLKILYIGEAGLGIGVMLFGVWALIRSTDTYKQGENAAATVVSKGTVTKVAKTSEDKASEQASEPKSTPAPRAKPTNDELAARRDKKRVERREAVSYGQHSQEAQKRRAVR